MSIKASRILGLGVALAAVGVLAACSSDDSPTNNNKGGSTSTAGQTTSGGGGASNGGSTTTAGTSTGGTTTGGTTTGGSTTGGAGGSGGGAMGACKNIKPTTSLITSFEDATAAGKFNIAIPGGTFAYPPKTEMNPSIVVDAATGKSLNVKGTIKDYSGFGIYLNDCHDAAGAGATGVSFTIKGNVGPSKMLNLRAQSNATTKYTAEGMKGLCPMTATYDTCHDNGFDIPVTEGGAEVSVTWDKFTGGVPVATVNGKDVLGFEWAFKWDTGDTEYMVDVTVDDIKWTGTISGGGGAGGAGGGGAGGGGAGGTAGGGAGGGGAGGGGNGGTGGQ